MGAPWAMAAMLGAVASLPSPSPPSILVASSGGPAADAPSEKVWLPTLLQGPAQRPQQAAAGARVPAPQKQARGEEPERPPAARLQRFAVQIVAPAPADDVVGRVRVLAEVAADRPAAVSAVDFFIDGRLMFSDAEAPYELLWDAGRPARHHIEVRAYGPGRQVVTDSIDTRAAAEGSSLTGFTARVERVELHVRVENENPPRGPLATDLFEVYENDVLQPVIAVERVADLPLAVGLLIDHSGSMLERLDTALEAAGTFVEGLLTLPDDKAFVLGFADLPIVFQEFTNDAARLAQAISLIEGGRDTALYDAVVAASRKFTGIDGRRAVMLLTDGADEGSEHRFADAIAAAQRADVALYPVAVDLSPRYARERWILNQLAARTGGRVFSLGRRSDPTEIYEAVRQDLRAQYRISYAPLVPGGGGEWRDVRVRLRDDVDGKNRVRARPGYFAR